MLFLVRYLVLIYLFLHVLVVITILFSLISVTHCLQGCSSLRKYLLLLFEAVEATTNVKYSSKSFPLHDHLKPLLLHVEVILNHDFLRVNLYFQGYPKRVKGCIGGGGTWV
jgi:hypothetical protein